MCISLTRPELERERTRRGKDGKVQRSFGFAEAFGQGSDFAQRRGLSAPRRTRANGCSISTSWGSLVRAQYRYSKPRVDLYRVFEYASGVPAGESGRG